MIDAQRESGEILCRAKDGLYLRLATTMVALLVETSNDRRCEGYWQILKQEKSIASLSTKSTGQGTNRRTCSSSLNRRMYGAIGRTVSDGRPYPI